MKSSKAKNNGVTPLYIAVQNGHMEVVQYLVEELKKSKENINPAANDGVTPLYIAAQNGHMEVVHLLSQPGTKTLTYNGGNETIRINFNAANAIIKHWNNNGPLTMEEIKAFATIYYCVLEPTSFTSKFLLWQMLLGNVDLPHYQKHEGQRVPIALNMFYDEKGQIEDAICATVDYFNNRLGYDVFTKRDGFLIKDYPQNKDLKDQKLERIAISLKSFSRKDGSKDTQLTHHNYVKVTLQKDNIVSIAPFATEEEMKMFSRPGCHVKKGAQQKLSGDNGQQSCNIF